MFGLHQGVYSPSLFFNSMLQLTQNMWINGYEVPLSHKSCLSKNFRTGPRRLKSRSISYNVLARRKKKMELRALDEKTWETRHVAPPHTHTHISLYKRFYLSALHKMEIWGQQRPVFSGAGPKWIWFPSHQFSPEYLLSSNERQGTPVHNFRSQSPSPSLFHLLSV